MPVLQVRDGQWVEQQLWLASEDIAYRVLGGWQNIGGEWRRFYLRPLETVLTITSDPPPDLVAGVDVNAGTVTGTAVDSLGRPLSGVQLEVTRMRVTSVGTMTSPGPAVTVAADGTWSFDYDYGIAGVNEINVEQYFLVRYPGEGPWQPSEVRTYGRHINSSSVTLTITSQPSGTKVMGPYDLSFSGTARLADGSAAPGKVRLVMVDDAANEADWGEVSIDANGVWQSGLKRSGVPGVRRLLVRYTPAPDGYEDATEVYGGTTTFVPDTPSFSKGSVGETSIAMSCSGIYAASGYQFYEGGTRRYSGTATSYTRSGLANYTTYSNWKVRAYAVSPGGSTYYSGFSSEHDARTGRPQKKDTGSKTVTITPAQTASYRNGSWTDVGDQVGQGAYTGFTQYGWYCGVIDFGGANKVRDALRAGLGGDGTKRQQNGTCTKTEVYLWKRAEIGTSGSVKIRWHRSNADVGGSFGSATYMVETTSTNGGSGTWYNLGTALGQTLGDGDQYSSQTRSIQIRNDSTGAYARFNGKSSGSVDCRLKLSWRWDYETQSKVSGTWLN